MDVSAASKSSRSYGVPIFLSAAVILLCLAVGAGFVWWYLKNSNDATIKLSSADQIALKKIESDAPPVAGVGPVQAIPRRRGPRPAAIGTGLPAGVFPSGDGEVIRAGQVLVRVGPGNPPTLVFREAAWGLLQDRPVFTIARRIVHEEPVARQLAISAEQMTALKSIAATPAVAGKYLAALPVDPKNMEIVQNLWLAYSKFLKPTNGPARDAVLKTLLNSVRVTGAAALTQARGEYDEEAAKIRDIITPRQIEAYRQGKSLTAP
jgi:hypothetical protein